MGCISALTYYLLLLIGLLTHELQPPLNVDMNSRELTIALLSNY